MVHVRSHWRHYNIECNRGRCTRIESYERAPYYDSNHSYSFIESNVSQPELIFPESIYIYLIIVVIFMINIFMRL